MTIERSISPLYLGSSDPELILYLPTPPVLPAAGSPTRISELIALNGNHWRKIFSILAKLSAPDGDWRSYRDNALLHRKEAISFDDSLMAGSARHLVAGKASWLRLGLNQDDFQPLDDRQRLWTRDNILLTPYPDYRQFPNALIEQTRALLSPMTQKIQR